MISRLDMVSYHQERRDQERHCAERASHRRARHSHAELARLHDLRRVLAYLGQGASDGDELIGFNRIETAI